MDNDANALVALITYGSSDVQLHGNTNKSIYNKHYEHITKSAFTYLTRPFVQNTKIPLDHEPTQCALRCDLSNDLTCDLVGECFLDMTFQDTITDVQIYESIDHISFCMGDTVLEKLTGKNLHIMSHVMFERNELVRDGIHVMLPIPFFFTRSTYDFMPKSTICKDDTHVDIVLANIKCNVSIVFKAIVLDTEERRDMLSRFLKLSMLSCVSETIFPVISLDSLKNVNIVLPARQSVRDIFIKIDGPGSDALETINVLFNGHLHMSLNRLMATHIIPRQSYGINHQTGLYIIPFCQDPQSKTHKFTTNVNMKRMDNSNLVLKFKTDMPINIEETKITLVIRRWDTLFFSIRNWIQ